VSFDGIQAVIIDDLDDLHLPIFEMKLEKSILELNDWSSDLSLDFAISFSSNYFNVTNSRTNS
jgi:vacuolar protein sorting-associated protein 13A/C